IAAGQQVLKYGQPIGIATQSIAAGEHIHEHNLRSLSREGIPVPAQGGRGGATPAAGPAPAASHAPAPPAEIPTFDGIVRPDGRVGTRNYVGCSARSTARPPWSSGSRRSSRRPAR